MIEYITADRLANAICQDTTYQGTYVLVEGNNDYTLFRKFFNREVCEVKISFGKDLITGVIKILEDRGFSNAIAIIDSDFHNLNGTKPDSERIFLTDCHDLESSIFKSEAINALLDQYCIKEKVSTFLEEQKESDIREALLNLITPLGYMKWANQQNDWGIIFKPKDPNSPHLKIEDFIPVNTIQFHGYEKMVNTVFNFARGKVKTLPDKEVVLESIKKISENKVDKFQLCNGHDIAYLFSLALRKKISNMNSKAVSPSQIESDLILTYDSRSFENTNLYRKIKAWEGKAKKEILRF